MCAVGLIETICIKFLIKEATEIGNRQYPVNIIRTAL